MEQNSLFRRKEHHGLEARTGSRKEKSIMTDISRPDNEIRPFRIDIPEQDLDDLRDRLRRTRWPDEYPT
jgi:hypothetical protein